MCQLENSNTQIMTIDLLSYFRVGEFLPNSDCWSSYSPKFDALGFHLMMNRNCRYLSATKNKYKYLLLSY